MATMPVSPHLQPPDCADAPADVEAKTGDILHLKRDANWIDIVYPDMSASLLTNPKLIAKLPKTLAEMADVTTAAIVLRIAERYGGTRLYFPRHLNPASELVKLVGLAAARVLCRHYGTEVVQVPRASALRRELRNREIHRLRIRGMPMGKIAARGRITKRQVQRILRSERDNVVTQPNARPAPRSS